MHVIWKLMLAMSSGMCFSGECYSHSHSKLYQDFLCFSMMYKCIKSLLPNSFLTFNLWISGTRSVVGSCMSLLFRAIQVLPHLISNTSHIQFFFTATLSDEIHLLTWINVYSQQIDSNLVRHMTLYLPKIALFSPS